MPNSKLNSGLLPVAVLLIAVGCTLPPTPSAEPVRTVATEPTTTSTAAPTVSPEQTESPTPGPPPTATAVPTSTPIQAAQPTATSWIERTHESGKEVIRFYNGQWGSISVHNAIAMYIVEVGYGYPVEEVLGTTSSLKVDLPAGRIDVSMELWWTVMEDWYRQQIAAGALVDLAGTVDSVPDGSIGQIPENVLEGFYVPSYLIEGDAERGIEAAAPELNSVFDLPRYKHLFADPSDPGKGAVVSCLFGWVCQKVIRAKWHAYGLYDDFNVIEARSSAELRTSIEEPYEKGEPFLSYYWEPTDVVNLRDLTLLQEPDWTPECQAVLDAAVLEEPYESEVGCAFRTFDVHSAVNAGLVERAPEVVDFLAEMFIGILMVYELEEWKAENDAEWADVAVKYLKENREVWTTWIRDANADEIIARVDAALASE